MQAGPRIMAGANVNARATCAQMHTCTHAHTSTLVWTPATPHLQESALIELFENVPFQFGEVVGDQESDERVVLRIDSNVERNHLLFLSCVCARARVNIIQHTQLAERKRASERASERKRERGS